MTFQIFRLSNPQVILFVILTFTCKRSSKGKIYPDISAFQVSKRGQITGRYISGSTPVSKSHPTLSAYYVNMTASVRSVTVGKGKGTTKAAAKRLAAAQALQYFHANGIPLSEFEWLLMSRIVDVPRNRYVGKYCF